MGKTEEKAFQDLGSVRRCFGCGPDNEWGFRIKSYWDGDEAVCQWTPRSYHCGGSGNRLNGGVIATLMDCHSLNLAIANAYREENREIGSDPKIYFITGQLSLSYLRPTPIDHTVHLRAKIVKREGRKVWVRCTLGVGSKVFAEGEVLGIRMGN